MAFTVLSGFMQKLLYFKNSLGVKGREVVNSKAPDALNKKLIKPKKGGKQSGRTILLKERNKDPEGLHGCWGGPLVSRTSRPAAGRKTAAAAHSLSRLAGLAR
jgi:hypothetical protein